jgi:N-acetylneuraminic acid mutarotase
VDTCGRAGTFLAGLAGRRLGRGRGSLARGGVLLAVLGASLLGLHGGFPARASNAGAQDGRWVTLASMPEARNEMAVVAVGQRIYLLGGNGPGADGPDPAVLIYDVATDRWSRGTPVPVAMHHAWADEIDGKIYLVGGYTNPFAERAEVDSLWMYDPATDRWEARAPLPAARGAHAVAALDGRLYAVGGERRRPAGSNPPYEPLAEVAAYDPRTDTWEVLPSLRYRRDHLTLSAANGHLYAIGGRDRPIYDLPFTEEYDPQTRTWTERAPMPSGRSGHGAAVLGGRIYTFGGEGNPNSPLGIYDEVEVYDPARDVWAQLSPMPTPRHAFVPVTIGSRIYLPGGSATRGGDGVTPVLDAFEPASAGG